MTPLDNILPRLDKLRQTGTNRWVACCPAHDDHNPSLSISETDDGTVLLHCFPGCPTQAVVDAMGLKMRDLFEGNADRVKAGEYPRANYRATLTEIRHPLWVVLLAAQDVYAGGVLTACDLNALGNAIGTINGALEVGHVRTK